MRIEKKKRPGLLARFTYWYSRQAYEDRVAAPLEVLAHHPTVMLGNNLYELAQLRAASVEPRLKRLAQLQVARLVGCPW